MSVDELKRLARDVAIIWVLTFLGGFIVGVATGGPDHDPNRFRAGLIVANLLTSTGGFILVGCLTPIKRWAHLARVAVGAWLTGLLSVAFFGVGVLVWLAGSISIALTMGLGGAISLTIVKRPAT